MKPEKSRNYEGASTLVGQSGSWKSNMAVEKGTPLLLERRGEVKRGRKERAKGRGLAGWLRIEKSYEVSSIVLDHSLCGRTK